MVPREYLGAFRFAHRKNVRHYIDDDLSWELLKKALDGCLKSHDTLLFIAKFNFEYYRSGVKKGDPGALHSTDVLRKDCYSRTNRLNRDTMAIVGSQVKSMGVTRVINDSAQASPEDAMISIIDYVKKVSGF